MKLTKPALGSITTQSLRGNSTLLLGLIGIFTITAVTFRTDLRVLWIEATNNDWENYILIIPFVVCYLLYSKRRVASTIIKASAGTSLNSVLAGIGLCLAALLLYFYGSYTLFVNFMHLLSMGLFVIGCSIATFGRKVFRIILFPLSYLFLITPPPLEFFSYAGGIFVNLTLSLAGNFLTLISIPVRFESSYMYLTSLSGDSLVFQVDVACSGIYSILAFFSLRNLPRILPEGFSAASSPFTASRSQSSLLSECVEGQHNRFNRILQ